MRTLVIGLPGCGKTTWAREHMTDDTLVYDLDAIAAALRLRDPHEEYHAGARHMANDFLFGFLQQVGLYAGNTIVIRTAPTVPQAARMKPDRIVWCRRRYVDRKADDEDELFNRIVTLARWAEQNDVTLWVEG